ncbi:MAG: aminoglycoside phosphotransferase [Lysobacteraceae bacterium]|nr:MAG: aminoglycoside phosphotransferase [Xanthomonadaceae bacterium]
MRSNVPRAQALRDFAHHALASGGIEISPASADASFRSYWRVDDGGTTRIVMDAPPDKEDIGPWLDIAVRLRHAGVHAPEVFAVDRAQGFVLMEDLGTRTFLPELDEHSVDALYGDALDALLRMQASVDVAGLPAYDRNRLVAEMELMPEWFLRRHLGFAPGCEQWDVIEAAFTFLVHAAQEQPRAFVHRDFHSRNLLVLERDGPGVIDFQDAVVGPLAYDLVSLLRDCYIEWDGERVEGWLESHRQRLRHAHLLGTDVDLARFRRWFDLIGLQRHIKVLGIFCRLWYRDGKPQYLADLPLVWRYALGVARRYPELADFASLLDRALGERDIMQPRADAPA